jgi:hypothetical protein
MCDISRWLCCLMNNVALNCSGKLKDGDSITVIA